MERIFKGQNGNLKINASGVTIERGIKGFLVQGSLRGEKLIPWDSIVAVQFKKASIFGGAGYIQLSIRGGSEAKKGLYEALQDENTISWSNLTPNQNNEYFSEAREIIEAKILSKGLMKTCPACAEDVKYAATLCRFCGHKFTMNSKEDKTGKSGKNTESITCFNCKHLNGSTCAIQKKLVSTNKICENFALY